MTEYEMNSAIKLSTEDEKMEIVEKIKLSQDSGFFEGATTVMQWHVKEIEKFLNAKSDQTTQIQEDQAHLGHIKDKANMGEIFDIDGWNQYGQATQGGVTVPFTCRDFPNFYRTGGTDTNGWTVMSDDGTNILLRRPVRFFAEKGFQLDRGYTMSAPAAKVIETLEQNASLDELGNVFGKQELSVFSSNLALAFNGVNQQFSLMQIFLKSLLYSSQRLSVLERPQNSMLTDAFPRLKCVRRDNLGQIPRSADGENIGFGSDADTCGVTWCTAGQLAALKRGTLRYTPVAGQRLGIEFLLSKPDDWALVPVDGDTLTAYALGGAPINGNFVASHLKYPCFINQFDTTYDNRWLLAGISPNTTNSDIEEIPIAGCNNIGGAGNVCFVLRNNMSTTVNGDMHINFGGVDVTVRHISDPPLVMNAAQNAAFEASCMAESSEGLCELLKVYGCSEGLELALKYLPLFTYGYMQTPLMSVGDQDVRAIFCCEAGTKDDKAAAMNRLNSAVCDPFARGYETVSLWYDGANPPEQWAKSYVYKLPSYTQLQSIGVACRVFQNLGSWKYNEWVSTATMGYQTFMPFIVDGVYFTDLLESLNRKTGAAYGAINSLGARAVGMPMAAIWEQTLIQFATLNLQFNELLMKKYYQQEVHSSVRLISNASNESAALVDMWGSAERQFNPAFNVSITNLYALGLMLNSTKLVSERFNEMDNKKKVGIRTTGLKTYKSLVNSWDTANLNLLGAIRVCLRKPNMNGGAYDPAWWFGQSFREVMTRFVGTWVRANYRTRSINSRDVIGARFARAFDHQLNPTTGLTYVAGESEYVVELINPFHNKLPGTYDTADDYYKAFKTNSGNVHAVEVVETDNDPWGVIFAEDYSTVKQDFDEMANAFRV